MTSALNKKSFISRSSLLKLRGSKDVALLKRTNKSLSLINKNYMLLADALRIYAAVKNPSSYILFIRFSSLTTSVTLSAMTLKVRALGADLISLSTPSSLDFLVEDEETR